MDAYKYSFTGKMMKRIIVFGDSNVAGDEMMDWMIPNHPGYLTLDGYKSDEQKAATKWYMDNSDNRSKLIFKPEIRERMKELSFTTQLEIEMGIPVENHGIGGSSMGRIKLELFRKVSEALTSGQDPKNLMVIFSNTGFNRFLHNIWGHDANILMGMGHEARGGMAILEGVLIRNWSDAFMLELHFNDILSCLDFLKAQGVASQFIDSSFLQNQIGIIDQHPDNYALLWNMRSVMKHCDALNYLEIPALIKSVRHHKVPKPMHPGRHFTNESHVVFAKDLADYLKSRHRGFV